MTPASLDAIGGFTPLVRHLADDLAIARHVIQAGGTICQTPYPQFISDERQRSSHYPALMHRWFLFALLLLREQSAGWTLAITLLQGLPPLLLWTLVPGRSARRHALAAPASIASAASVASAVPSCACSRCEPSR